MKKIFILLMCLLAFANASAQNDVQNELSKLKSRFPEKYKEIQETANKATTPEERDALDFLMAYSPLSDLADYSTDFIFENAKQALRSRTELPWGNLVNNTLFKHFVLPPRINNENLDSFRILMYEELRDRVKGLSMYDAALEVNHWCHERVTYQASDGRTSSPLSTIRYSFGRCGEESTLLVAALRTVGIPARQVYTPRWAHTDDNHAWVEVWVNGKWYFMGACEPSPELNMGWFAVPSTRTMFVNTRVFGKYANSQSEPVIVSSDKYSELNLISNYTKTKNINVRVLDHLGKAISNAKVDIQLYNYSEFFTLAKLNTDEAGQTNFKTGLGDLVIWASQGDKYAFAKVGRNDSNILLTIPQKPNYKSIDMNITPPDEGEPVKVEAKNIALNERRLQYEDSMRNEYMKTFLDSATAIQTLADNGISDNYHYSDYLIRSYGNWREILRYIVEAEKLHPCNNAIHQLLSVISEKDLRDTRSYILLGHLNAGLALKNHNYDEEIWKNYILNGRIANENMIDWRNINDAINQKIGNSVQTIVQFINNEISIDNIGNMHSRAPLTPLGVLNLKAADNFSRDILFVALCRYRGIPSRLNTGTSIPQYYSNDGNSKEGTWIDVDFNKAKESSNNIDDSKNKDKAKESSKYGTVSFINKSKFEPKYYSNFTIRRFENGGYHTIDFDDIMPLSQMAKKMEVPAGKYMLMTGNRKQYGEVLAKISYFDVRPEQNTKVAIKVRDIPKDANPWTILNTKNYSIELMNDAKEITLDKAINGKAFILAIIEPDKEPTKHFLADLKILQQHSETKNLPLIFLIEKSSQLPSNTIKLLQNTPSAIIAFDANRNILNKMEDLKREKLDKDLPIVIYGKANGELFYFNKGYKIGIIDEIIRIIK